MSGSRCATLMALLSTMACTSPAPGDAPTPRPRATTTLAQDVATLRNARIFFTHHSVGRNLLSGLQRIDAEQGGGSLRIVDLKDATGDAQPALLHASGGRNTAPDSKIDFFLQTLREPTDRKLDLAFMKFCYVDFNPRTQVAPLYTRYMGAIAALEQKHPEISFAHVTIPLVTRPTDWKSRLRRLLGLEVWEDAANVKRSEWNERLRAAVSAERLFDLARVESTRPDATAERFTHAGKRYESLSPAYTDDSGHLNELGQRTAAEEMIRFAARALRARAAAPR